MLEVLYHHAEFGGARISPAAGAAKNVESVCMFVCLFVTLLNVRDFAPDLEQSASARHHHILSINLQSTSEDLPLCTVLLASIKCPRMTLVVRTLICSR